MKILKALIKFLVWSALVLSLLVSCVYLLAGPKQLGPYLLQLVIAEARGHKLALNASATSYNHFSAQFEDVTISSLSPKIPLFLKLNRIGARIDPVSLLTGTVLFDVDGELLNGNFNAGLDYSFISQKLKSKFLLNKLDISAHPQAAFLGVTSGVIEAEFEGAASAVLGIEQGKFFLVISKLEKPEATKIELIRGLPLTLPRVLRAGLDLRGMIRGKDLVIEVMSFSSNLGTVKGNGSILTFRSEKHSALDISADIRLSADGSKEIGPYLSLASGGKIQPETAIARLKVTGSLSAPFFNWQAIENSVNNSK